MAAFTWGPTGRAAARFAIMDGREVRTAFRNGTFDLAGMLSALEYRCRRLKARRIAFDGLDVLLDMIDDPSLMRREVYRLADWLAKHSLTAVITARREGDDGALPARYAFLPFLSDCVIVLQHRVVGRTALRELRILKCRGVAHSSNELPLVLSSAGIEIEAPRTTEMKHRVFSERISTGVDRLDTMLEGGYLRGTCTLISGAPGTSKTFARRRLRRGLLRARRAHALRQLRRSRGGGGAQPGVGDIRLGRFLRSRLLRIYSVRVSGSTPETHTLCIRALLKQHQARCLVIDPVSALLHAGASDFATEAVLGMLDMTKRLGVTVVLTSLLEGSAQAEEDSAMGISTNADTWLHLSYIATSGERNRAPHHRQVARHRPFEPGPRAGARAKRHLAGRRLHRGRRRAHGSVAAREGRQERAERIRSAGGRPVPATTPWRPRLPTPAPRSPPCEPTFCARPPSCGWSTRAPRPAPSWTPPISPSFATCAAPTRRSGSPSGAERDARKPTAR
jgi:circadian clock protein KaiC